MPNIARICLRSTKNSTEHTLQTIVPDTIGLPIPEYTSSFFYVGPRLRSPNCHFFHLHLISLYRLTSDFLVKIIAKVKIFFATKLNINIISKNCNKTVSHFT